MWVKRDIYHLNPLTQNQTTIPMKPSAQPHTGETLQIFCHTHIPTDPEAKETLSRQKLKMDVYGDAVLFPPTAPKPQCCAVDLTTC